MAKVIDFGKARDARRTQTKRRFDKLLVDLRAMPVNARADVLVGLFSMVVSEFSRMILDNSTPPPKAKRYVRKLKRRADVQVHRFEIDLPGGRRGHGEIVRSKPKTK